MWLIINVIGFTNLYVYLYSQILFSYFKNNEDTFYKHGDKCSITSSSFVYNFVTITERLIQYVLWICPIIYVFWPADRTWYGYLIAERKKSLTYSTVGEGPLVGKSI